MKVYCVNRTCRFCKNDKCKIAAVVIHDENGKCLSYKKDFQTLSYHDTL